MKYTKENINEENGFVLFWRPIGSFGYMSQWYSSEFSEDNVIYKTAEHYMMAQKAKLFRDDYYFNKIIEEDNPANVKKFGRKIAGFDPEKWNENKYDIVKNGNLLKFSQNSELKNLLTENTRNAILVEASPYDRIWGIGLEEKDKRCLSVNEWQGENLLGFALMEVRDVLKK